MTKPHRRVCIYLLAIAMFSMSAWADTFAVGVLIWGVHSPGSAGSFDIANETGANSSPLGDPTFPVVTALTFSGLSLNVGFTDASSHLFGSSYFTDNGFGDGGFNGGDIGIGGANPLPVYAQLAGKLGPASVTLNDGSTAALLPDLFVGPIGSVGGPELSEGDFAVIFAHTAGGTTVPEPGSWMLLLTCVGGIMLAIRKKHFSVQGGRSL